MGRDVDGGTSGVLVDFVGLGVERDETVACV